MSLINQMLQDLDARGTTVADADVGITPGQVRFVPERRQFHPVWWVGGVLVLGMLALLLRYWFFVAPAAVPTMAPATVVALQANVPQVNSAAPNLDHAPATGNSSGTQATFTLKLASELSMVPLPTSQKLAAEEKVALLATPVIKNQVSAKSSALPKESTSVEVREPQTKAPAVQEWNTPALDVKSARSDLRPNPARLPSSDTQISLNKQVKVLTPKQNAENEYRHATTLVQQGKVQEAISSLEESLHIDPQHVAARQTLVGVFLDVRRYDDAMRRLKEGLVIDPHQSGWAMILARLQVDKGQLRPAIETLQRSAPYSQERADYHAFIAALLQRETRHKEAVDQYRVALRKAPQNGVWWMGLGISLLAENRTVEATEAFARAKASGTLSSELRIFVEEKLAQLPH